MRRLDNEIERSKRREEAAAHARAEIFRQARGQTALATNFADLLGDGGPPDETADEMIRSVREWRDIPSNGSLD